ncbi:hypothetical protein SLNSH_24240 [Alsobacter soli]|uniref:DUF305 domain-containing protein n=1 Tax=Alsobacter soli TaxID=2109933 RepID=A0A2T1HL96_9HYPH|nr:hypothetical protein [Alsobacter soli]PSC02410.1 hypothetical protein SLNSH_24240 [Alsobacter soli]
MRIAAILLTIGALAAPAYAQTGDAQDHSAHHPAEAAPAPSADAVAPQPAPSVRAEGSAGASAAMGCPMMPEMMQSMMQGMAAGSAQAGAGMPSGMGSGMGSGMAAGGARAAAFDQSLAGITYRAIAQRAVAALQASPARQDAEFARLAVALEEALADAAKTAAAFSDDPDTRRRAQQLAASHQDDLQALRAWGCS